MSAKTTLAEPSLILRDLLYRNWKLTGKYQQYGKDIKNPRLGVTVRTGENQKMQSALDILITAAPSNSIVSGGIVAGTSSGYIYQNNYRYLIEVTAKAERGQPDTFNTARQDRWILYQEAKRIS